MLLRIEQLTKDYDSFRALDGLDLAVAPGEVFGLLGPNGSGKTTALRLVLGFLRPTAGRAVVAGFDCWAQSVEVRKRVAYLPGELRLYESMTGRQIVGFLAKLRGAAVDGDLDALAKRLDIDPDRPLVQMSSGMKRKVALLQVLLAKVPLLILDEPTNALDPTMRDELLLQLRQARDRGQTVLFSSHVLAEVERVCDRVAILRRGRLAHLQTMRDLLAGRWVRVRFESPPVRWPEAVGAPPAPDAEGVYSFEFGGDLRELLGWLGSQPVRDLRIEPAGLAPIYHRFHGNSS